MRVDRDGRLLQQLTIFVPAEMVDLLKADGLNVSQFIRDQIAYLYCEPTASQNNSRDRLVQAAQESIARHRAVQAERDADVERARDAVRELRARRQVALNRQDRIAEALAGIVGKNVDTYRRLLPENDPHGDRVDDWEALVRRISHLCGAEVDSGEVAIAVRRLTAK